MKKNYPAILVGAVILIVLILLITKGQNNFFHPPIPPSSETHLTPQLVSSSPSATTNIKTLNLRLFFAALNDDGKHGEKLGCGDSVAPVNIQVPETPTPLQAIMQQLLSIKQQTVGPSKLYNSLYQSNLQLKDVSIKDGVAIIHLTGTTKMGGECDNPRFESQLKKTALQFSNINSVQIFINDKPLSEIVSLK